jgi:hypothetical protein
MITAENFALRHWLDEYPEDMDYQTILELVADGDKRIEPIGLMEYEPTQSIVEHIEATKRLFLIYIRIAMQEAKP